MFHVSCFMLEKDEVKHIAALARIGLGEDEMPKYQKELSAILDYFKKLGEVDTEKIEPIGHITGRFNSYRGDKQEDFGDLGKEAITKLFPESKDGYDKVKSVL
jgi:aspartyl-tRNA(Asn)/glutamyl-tRNA(Gln) amidotransferase subunit C